MAEQQDAAAEDRVAKREVGVYFGSLWLIFGLATPWSGLAQIPVQFILKDQLHLGPATVAAFGAITWMPLYFSFLFGFVRDRWHPFGLGDRGYLLLSAPLAAAVYIWVASASATYARCC